MFQNYYHLPIMRRARTLARKTKILTLVKRMISEGTTYEESFHDALKSSVESGNLVWDVGANRGLYTKLFVAWAGENGRVVAFEPGPETFENLQKELKTYSSVVLFRKALSDEPGMSYFSSKGANDVTAHLVEEENDNTIQVELTTADLVVQEDISLQPNVVKIDVEGFEEEVIKGGAETFKHANCKHIFVEIHFAEMEKRKMKDSPNKIVRMLKDWGYTIQWVDASHIHAFR